MSESLNHPINLFVQECHYNDFLIGNIIFFGDISGSIVFTFYIFLLNCLKAKS